MKSILARAFVAMAICASLGACATNQNGQYSNNSNNSNCRNGTNYGAAALGVLAGGIIGAQFGGGIGNSVAIAAGAGAGAIVGNNMGCN